MTNKNLAQQIVKALEVGVEKQLNGSIFYSPFRFFYNKFKRNNPGTMEGARQTVRNDVETILTGIPNFNPAIFIDENGVTPLGKKLLNVNYSIGINLLKRELTVIKAFRVVTNSDFRMQIYDLVLSMIKKSAINLTQSSIEE